MPPVSLVCEHIRQLGGASPRAAKLAANPVGESPIRGDYPVATVVISSARKHGPSGGRPRRSRTAEAFRITAEAGSRNVLASGWDGVD